MFSIIEYYVVCVVSIPAFVICGIFLSRMGTCFHLWHRHSRIRVCILKKSSDFYMLFILSEAMYLKSLFLNYNVYGVVCMGFLPMELVFVVFYVKGHNTVKNSWYFSPSKHVVLNRQYKWWWRPPVSNLNLVLRLKPNIVRFLLLFNVYVAGSHNFFL